MFIMKKLIIIFLLFGLISCTNESKYITTSIDSALIVQTTLPNDVCIGYYEPNIVDTINQYGILIDFELEYFGSSGAIAPGYGGSRDSIESIRIELWRNNYSQDITDLLTCNQMAIDTSRYDHYDETRIEWLCENGDYISSLSQLKEMYNSLHQDKMDDVKPYDPYDPLNWISCGDEIDYNKFHFWFDASLEIYQNDSITMTFDYSDNKTYASTIQLGK